VPQQASPDFTGLNVALRLSLPVFVARWPRRALRSTGPPPANGDGRARRHGAQQRQCHARVISFSAAPGRAPAAAVQQNVTAYILPGQARTWTIDNKKNNETTSNTTGIDFG